MKNKILVSTSILMMLIFTNSCGQENRKVQVVKPSKFEAILKSDPNVVLLDVRTPEEFEKGNITNSTNIDFYADDFSKKIAELDKDKTYLIYCRSGNRSNKTALMLNENGVRNVFDLDGGINAWQAAGLPVKK